MKIATIGAGKVAQALAGAFTAVGHSVRMGVRAPSDAKYAGLDVGSVRDVVAWAEVVVLATPWGATREAVESAGDFGGRVVIDATNPLGPGLVLTHAHGDSGGEQVQRWATGARVVKAFNTTGLENMRAPAYPEGRAAMWVCGDDRPAVTVVSGLAREIGFEAVEVGPLSRARLLEPVAALWIHLAMVQGNGRDIALGLLRREHAS